MAQLPVSLFVYRYAWGQAPCAERKGQRCKIVRKNERFAGSVVIEFEDGARFAVSRSSLHRA